MKCSPPVATARRRLSSLVSLILATLLASGCMRTNIEMLSPVEYAPVDPDSVQVFLTADEAPSRRVQLAVVTSVQQGGTPGADEANRERVTLLKRVSPSHIARLESMLLKSGRTFFVWFAKTGWLLLSTSQS